MKSRRIEVRITGTHTVLLPDSLVLPFVEAGHKRIEVVAWFETREHRFHAALLKRNQTYSVMFSKRHQKSLGIFPNDYFTIQLLEDQTEFGVVVPEELQEVFLQWPEAEVACRSLSDGGKRSLIYAIRRCKTPQIRINKALLACERLVSGVRNSRDLIRSKV